MHKLGIFVEGQTELLFVERLLQEIANANQLTMELFGASGGASGPLRMTYLRGCRSADAKHYVQIVNCQSDGNVKPYIRDRYAQLAGANFWGAIGLRDVFPLSSAQVPYLRSALPQGIQTKPVKVEFILGVMEIEAWFIAETSHFLRLSPILTSANIAAHVGFDPAVIDLQTRLNPAADLNSIYHLAGLAYTKRQKNCMRTVDNLDCARLYCEIGDRFLDLRNLIQIIDKFLALS